MIVEILQDVFHIVTEIVNANFIKKNFLEFA